MGSPMGVDNQDFPRFLNSTYASLALYIIRKNKTSMTSGIRGFLGTGFDVIPPASDSAPELLPFD